MQGNELGHSDYQQIMKEKVSKQFFFCTKLTSFLN